MKSYEIRQKFLDYFSSLNHTIVESSPVIPYDDPTLLFTNAGMNQFKDVLLGLNKRNYSRAASVQKCIRAGGKHNDLENVGFTARHLTFFEMLGNWSFGDYYKKEAIQWAWKFLTDVLKLPEKKLFVSIYKDDEESFDIWHNLIGLPVEKIVRLGDIENGDEENFWSMGDTGPCGPCTEIHFDTETECNLNNSNCNVDCDCDRYLEIWNNVFMQYNRNNKGKLIPLKQKCVDTGMGLERLAAILQGVSSNFDTDLFIPIILQIQKFTDIKYTDNPYPFRVIADHIRCLTFAIADGGLPGNEGRNYVLRRILRRAVRFAKKLNINNCFLYTIVNSVVEQLGIFYPEIKNKQIHIEKIIKIEEEKFLTTIDKGIEIFNSELKSIENNKNKIFPGETAFLLYDTYGFPVDLTELMAKENNFKVDIKTFNKKMIEQKNKSKENSKFNVNYDVSITKNFIELNEENKKSEFIGYNIHTINTNIIKYFATENNTIEIILEKTPFYAESGGEVGDTGKIYNDNIEFEVIDTIKYENDNLHICKLIKGDLNFLKNNISITAEIDLNKRLAIQKNHTATHLLQKALRTVLGSHIVQSGSLVNEKRLRFDYSHYEKPDKKDLEKIEDMINSVIQQNLKMSFMLTDIKEAKKLGAMALFGEKYGDIVRVVKAGDFSIELCGGAHVNYLGEIALFKIISESSVSSGIRRIEAVTGFEALTYYKNLNTKINNICNTINSSVNDVENKLNKLITENKDLNSELKKIRKKILSNSKNNYFDNIKKIKNIDFLNLKFENEDLKNIKQIIDEFKNKFNNGIIIVLNKTNKKNILIIGVGTEISKKHPANNIIKKITSITKGGGGGKEMFAQGSIVDNNKFDEAINLFLESI